MPYEINRSIYRLEDVNWTALLWNVEYATEKSNCAHVCSCELILKTHAAEWKKKKGLHTYTDLH